MTSVSTVRTSERKLQAASTPKPSKRKIWVDLDNSPHVPFFRPIIEELRKRNYVVFVTARDAYQVRELTEFYGVEATILGRHYGKHKVLKALGTFWRTLGLTGLVRKQKPDIAVCHGSRAMLLTSALLGIPCLTLVDYEFTTIIPFIKPTWFMVPSVVPENAKGMKMLKYPGIKEDVYLSRFTPDQTVKERLGVPVNNLLVTVRPPATEAHYHNPEAETLLVEALRMLLEEPNTTILLLPRNKRQDIELRSAWAEDIDSQKIIIPIHVEDGLNLIWNSDLVISGGGTMNREAAAMGVPVYSIFRGKIGAVDRYLAEQGRLVLLETVEDVRAKVKISSREKTQCQTSGGNSSALETIVGKIISLVEFEAVASEPSSD